MAVVLEGLYPASIQSQRSIWMIDSLISISATPTSSLPSTTPLSPSPYCNVRACPIFNTRH